MSRYDPMNIPPTLPMPPDTSWYKEACKELLKLKTVGPAFFQRCGGLTYNQSLAALECLSMEGALSIDADKYGRRKVVGTPACLRP